MRQLLTAGPKGGTLFGEDPENKAVGIPGEREAVYLLAERDGVPARDGEAMKPAGA